jgi:hypothetical protein
MRVDVEGAKPLFAYFAWAIEANPATDSVARYLAGAGDDVNARVVARRVEDLVAEELFLYRGQPLRYELWRSGREFSTDPVLARPRDYAVWLDGLPDTAHLEAMLGADERELPSARLQEAAYQLMLTSFLGSLGDLPYAMSWLGRLMVRGGLNRQLTIATFLGLVTDGRIGIEPGPPDAEFRAPDPEAVLTWARRAIEDGMSSRFEPRPTEQGDGLEHYIAEYVGRVRRSRQWERGVE